MIGVIYMTLDGHYLQFSEVSGHGGNKTIVRIVQGINNATVLPPTARFPVPPYQLREIGLENGMLDLIRLRAREDRTVTLIPNTEEKVA